MPFRISLAMMPMAFGSAGCEWNSAGPAPLYGPTGSLSRPQG